MPIAGSPLVTWTLKAVAEAATRFRLVVTTDCEDIAAVSHSYGAEVVQRPHELARDTSPTEPAVAHVLEQLEIAEDSCLVILQATSPVRWTGSLDRAYSAFVKSGTDSLVAVVEESPFMWWGPIDSPTPMYDVSDRPRRQDFEPNSITYREVGSFYFSWAGPFLRQGNRIHGLSCLYVLDKYEGIDVDEPYDAKIAEAILLTATVGQK
jgi:N-acylneuraminate cytidylyltransferase